MGNSKARLTPFGRKLLVDRILVNRWPVAHAAEAAGVSRQTASRWLKRWREEGEPGLQDRSSRPHNSPNRVPTETEERIVSDRIREKEGTPFDGMAAGCTARFLPRTPTGPDTLGGWRCGESNPGPPSSSCRILRAQPPVGCRPVRSRQLFLIGPSGIGLARRSRSPAGGIPH